MKLTALFATLLATALIAVAAPPQGPRGPVEGRGFRQGPPPWTQVDKLPADVQPLVKEMQEKMKELQALRAQIHEKMVAQNGEAITGRGPWARRGMEKAGERPERPQFRQGPRGPRGPMMNRGAERGPRGPMMHRERVRGEKKVEEAK